MCRYREQTNLNLSQTHQLRKSESKSTQPPSFLRSVKKLSPTFKSELFVVDEMLERRWVAQCMAVLGVSSVRRMECKPELNDKLNG